MAAEVRLRLGTRGSALALRQAGLVAAELERHGSAVDDADLVASVRRLFDLELGDDAGTPDAEDDE